MNKSEISVIHKILWATDFSRESMACLPYIEIFHQKMKVEPHALYVLPRFSDWVYDAAFFSLEDLHQEIESTRKKSTSKLEEIGANKKIKFSIATREGVPSEEILNYASDQSVDMIFSGRRGLTEIEQILVGSTTMRLIRNTHTPVFVVPRERRKARINRILAPVDLNESSMRELCFSISLARQLKAELVVAHVAEFYNYKVPMLKRDRLIARINQQISKVAEKLDYRIENIIHETGEPAHKILQIIQDQKIDVAVMATNQRKGLEKFLLGSVTQKVLLATDIPLIVLPANGAASSD